MSSAELTEYLLASPSDPFQTKPPNYQSLDSNRVSSQSYPRMTESHRKANYGGAASSLHSLGDLPTDVLSDGDTAADHQPLMQQSLEEDMMIAKQDTAISMQDGAQPTNVNVISAFKKKAANHSTAARVDNIFLYSSIPKWGDMFMDHQTSAITLVHIGFAFLTLVLIALGYLMQIEDVWRWGTFLCLVTNAFGIAHSMYSGSMSNKVARLDAAIQNFAVIIQKFAKALSFQEVYLSSTKHILDFVDHHVLLLEHQNPDMDKLARTAAAAGDGGGGGADGDDDGDGGGGGADEEVDYKRLWMAYYEFVEKLKQQTVTQHKKWLLTFYGQYKVLDNRVGITNMEYLDFVRKLPNKPRTFFQSLTGLQNRFKQLQSKSDADAATGQKKQNLYESVRVDLAAFRTESMMAQELGENTVLLYKDMQDLVYKVMKDLDHNKFDKLAEKMLSFERHKMDDREHPGMTPIPNANNSRNILAQRMTLSLAANAPQIRMRDSTLLGDREEGAEESMGIVNDDEEKYHAPDLMDVGVGGRSNLMMAKSPVSIPVVAPDREDREISFVEKQPKMAGTLTTSVRERTLTIDDEWVVKVMNDLQDGDDSHRYDYSHSERL